MASRPAVKRIAGDETGPDRCPRVGIRPIVAATAINTDGRHASLLAPLKLQDVGRFVTMFLDYDLLARAYVPYAYVDPFA